jgi:hypothetical protein
VKILNKTGEKIIYKWGNKMALGIPVITVTGVTESQAKLFRISFRMAAIDDDSNLSGIDVSYTINYKQGNNVSAKVGEIVEFFQEQIDRYKNSVGIWGSSQLVTALTSISAGLVV